MTTPTAAAAVDAALPDDLVARAAAVGDEPEIRALFATTLPPGLGEGPLAELQLTAQRRGFRDAFPDGEELVVLREELVVARVCLGREPGALRIVDVVVAPAVRRRGVGRAVVAAVQTVAAADGLAVRLQVVRDATPALALYDGLGFVADADPGDLVRRPLVWPAG